MFYIDLLLKLINQSISGSWSGLEPNCQDNESICYWLQIKDGHKKENKIAPATMVEEGRRSTEGNLFYVPELRKAL